MTTKPQSQYTRREVARLAALSRAFQEARADIGAALVQELMIDPDPDHRTDVGVRFGIPEGELHRYFPEEILRVCEGALHRSGLQTVREVLAEVRSHLGAGRMKPGERFPPRTAFTETYRCTKAVHREVVAYLMRGGVIHQPGDGNGPLYVLSSDWPDGGD